MKMETDPGSAQVTVRFPEHCCEPFGLRFLARRDRIVILDFAPLGKQDTDRIIDHILTLRVPGFKARGLSLEAVL